MSPDESVVDMTVWGFPRVSGDEPDKPMTVTRNTRFSPRERG